MVSDLQCDWLQPSVVVNCPVIAGHDYRGELVAGRKGTGLKSVILSTLSAAFGVQKKSRLEKDFQQGKPVHFIVAGVVGTALLIMTLLLVVQAVLGMI